ncbi:hypothetical protein SJI00_21175 [Pseudomonas sp. RP23018S]|uniref:hypothetical protein n=1 Tax=Pseudomonas sp. RP23018S TaxID=3096037 RepID=UPI002ACAB6AA|nr:hypothetical protein [Pseudomonas sp. RP23018S]MDZ5605290.1 hypothetical protein [Pseudomonas sp. RP23018S]
MTATFKIKSLLGRGSAWLSQHTVPGMTIDAKLASIFFAGKRGDYYTYLADTIAGTRGRKSLIDIFQSDVNRYGNSARGKLSAHWIKQFKSGGGSLQRTFAGTLPDEDVAVLDTLLKSGGEKALDGALRDLAENSELLTKARMIMFVTLIASVMCMAMTTAMVILMPSYTVPKIVEAFSMLPLDHYPGSARELVEFAGFVESSKALIISSTVAIFVAVTLSLSRVTGRPRRFLDKYGLVWGLYRDFQSIRFLSTLAALVRESDKTAVNLKPALQMQINGATRWKRYHLSRILAMVSRGNVGPDIFTTGIMDKTMQWYISDLVESQGLSEALQYVKIRLKQRVLKKITLQSALIAWGIMGISIGVSIYLLGWHMTAIDDLRRSLQMFLA